jgi:phosphomannomutase
LDDLEQPTTGLPPTDGLRFVMADDSRVVVRPSGTEPKLKCYLEVIVPVPGGPDGATRARHTAAEALGRLRSDVAAALGVADAT